MDLLVLFMSAFAASTILPMSSEVVLGALAASATSDRALLLVVATAGNTLGAVVNWGIGRYAASWRGRLPLPDEGRFERATRWFNRWGIWCLLFSWLPVVGDPLTLVAGVLRTPLRSLPCARAGRQSRPIPVRPAHRALRREAQPVVEHCAR